MTNSSAVLSQETQYLASILIDKLVQCICRNINCAQGKQCLHSRCKFISIYPDWGVFSGNVSARNVQSFQVCTSSLRHVQLLYVLQVLSTTDGWYFIAFLNSSPKRRDVSGSVRQWEASQCQTLKVKLPHCQYLEGGLFNRRVQSSVVWTCKYYLTWDIVALLNSEMYPISDPSFDFWPSDTSMYAIFLSRTTDPRQTEGLRARPARDSFAPGQPRGWPWERGWPAVRWFAVFYTFSKWRAWKETQVRVKAAQGQETDILSCQAIIFHMG